MVLVICLCTDSGYNMFILVTVLWSVSWFEWWWLLDLKSITYGPQRCFSHTIIQMCFSFYTGNVDTEWNVRTHKGNCPWSRPSCGFSSSCWGVWSSFPSYPEKIMDRVRKILEYSMWSPTWRRRGIHYKMCDFLISIISLTA